MTAKPSQQTQTLLKEQRLREILSLPKHQGPLEAKAIAATQSNTSTQTTNHYIDELLIARKLCRHSTPDSVPRLLRIRLLVQ